MKNRSHADDILSIPNDIIAVIWSNRSGFLNLLKLPESRTPTEDDAISGRKAGNQACLTFIFRQQQQSNMSDITLYSHASGPNPWKVVALLKELNLSYNTIFVDFQNKTPDFLSKNPNGRAPAIVDHKRNDKALWESVAILLYLEHHYDKENRLWFTNEDEIADANQWLLFQASGIGPYFGQKAWFSNFHHEKIPSAIERYEKEVHRVLGVVEKHLEGKEYFVGNKYSIVDINNYVWLVNVPWLLNDYQTAFEKYPNTGAYVKRLGEHKGIKEAYAEKAAAAEKH
ncbi:hypothetical protein PROFUN_06750 [Planoprotostelium fungivorum]|uniref:Glutathione S-transferase n=1 Tax=Planoprotostelium fungivorum TaxID=1890364 RepID=A0A2P6NNP3_9EUKA|nr:hypothetical protein PROFUN_06750 [Planoprotostelium fungivorum]